MLKPKADSESPRLAVAGLAVAFSMTILAGGCSRPDSNHTPPVRSVKPLTLERSDILRTRSFSGRVDASKRVDLAFQVPGVLVKLPVKEGQRVAKGEIIAELRLDGFQARVDTVQAQLDQAHATLDALRLVKQPSEQLQHEAQERVTAVQLANARAEFDRYVGLVQSGAVSRSEYESAIAAYRIAEEDHKAAVQQLEAEQIARRGDIESQEAAVHALASQVVEAKLHLADATLRAPYDGVVAQRFVDEGQSITTNKPVVALHSIDGMDIIADVPMTSGICSSAIAAMTAAIKEVPGRQYPVQVKEVGQIPDPTTGAFRVRFAIKAPLDVALVPGMTASITFIYRHTAPEGRPTFEPISSVCEQGDGAKLDR